jgi:large exoprotein involved in heme utilization and adhesion
MGGNVNVSANNLEVINNAVLGTFSEGFGDSGNIVLSILETVRLDGDRTSANGFRTSIYSNLSPGGVGAGGNIDLFATNLEITNGAQIFTLTGGNGNAGNIKLDIGDTVLIDGFLPFDEELSSNIASDVFLGAMGNGGSIDITAANLQVVNGARISTSGFGVGDAGNILLDISNSARFEGVNPVNGIVSSVLSLIGPDGIGNGGNIEITTTHLNLSNGARIAASTAGSGIGNGGNIEITTTHLNLSNGAQIAASTAGSGDAGNVLLQVYSTATLDGFNTSNTNPEFGIELIEQQVIGAFGIPITIIVSSMLGFAGLDGNASGILSSVEPGGEGSGGNVSIITNQLEILNGAQLRTSSFGLGDAGNLVLVIDKDAHFSGFNSGNGSPSGAASIVETDGIGNTGDLVVTAANLAVIDGAQLSTAQFGQGSAGDIHLTVSGQALFDGANSITEDVSGIFSNTPFGSSGNGGSLRTSFGTLELLNGATFSTSSFGTGDAGSIQIDIDDQLRATSGTIETSTLTASGGNIDISAKGLVLEGDSDIQTFVLSGAGGGGNITITTDLLIALNDSDILAFSDDGTGGNITLQTSAFFGENFTLDSLNADPATLDGNNRVDINATGAVSGVVSIPDVSFVENSLNDLTENIVATDQVLVGSCITRAGDDQGTFVNIGSGGLPTRPGDTVVSNYATGEVQPLHDSVSQTVWQPGNPIIEPTGAFALADGRLILSRECD